MAAGDEVSPETLLREAEAFLADGRLGLADFRVSDILDRAPAHPGALAVRSAIAARLGLAGYAPPRDGLLVIKAWRQGFWSEIAHVLGCALLAELTGRTPVTLWGANCLYGDDEAADAFRLYFEPLSAVTPEDLVDLTGDDFFPAKWARGNLFRDEFQKYAGEGARLPGIAFLARPERVAVVDFHVSVADLVPWIPPAHPLHGRTATDILHTLAAKYLRPTTAVQEQVAALDRAARLSDIEIAIHARGSDKALELANLDEVNAHYLEFLPQIYKGGRVLLLTEDERLIPRFATLFGDKLVVADCIRQIKGVAPHWRAGIDRVQMGMEAVRDVYAAAGARTFLGNGRSALSCMAAALRVPGSETYLVGGNVLAGRSDYKFTMKAPRES